MTIGERIRVIRVQRKLNQKQFCKEIHTSQATLWRIEANTTQPSINLIKQIILKFNINQEWIMYGIEPMYIENGNSSSTPPESNDVLIAFEERLRELRKIKGLSQKELGNIVGLSESAIFQFENGKRKPNSDSLMKLKNYFNVTIDYLLGISNNTDFDKIIIDKLIIDDTKPTYIESSNSSNISSDNSNIFDTFGSRLKDLRMRKNLSQIELAKQFNTTPQTIGRYEKNEREPEYSILLDIAKYFKVTTDYLLGRENSIANKGARLNFSISTDKNNLTITFNNFSQLVAMLKELI